MAEVKLNQIYAELEGKKRYLLVDQLSEDEATCIAGWRGRTGIAWSHRRPVVPKSDLLDPSMYRLEADS